MGARRPGTPPSSAGLLARPAPPRPLPAPEGDLLPKGRGVSDPSPAPSREKGVLKVLERLGWNCPQTHPSPPAPRQMWDLMTPAPQYALRKKRAYISGAFLQRTLSRALCNCTERQGETEGRRAFCRAARGRSPQGRVTGPPSFRWLLRSCAPGPPPPPAPHKSSLPGPPQAAPSGAELPGCGRWCGRFGPREVRAGHCPRPAGDGGREDPSHGAPGQSPGRGLLGPW